MKHIPFNYLIGILLLLSIAGLLAGRQGEPWQPDQLMEPAQLAAILADDKADKPLVISIGPAATIKTSLAAGPAGEKTGLGRLDTLLRGIDRNQPIVIYCGCCPFDHCPNVRPAFTLVNRLGFKKQKLLNLSKNLKVDWIDKGYPVID